MQLAQCHASCFVSRERGVSLGTGRPRLPKDGIVYLENAVQPIAAVLIARTVSRLCGKSYMPIGSITVSNIP